MEPIHSIDAEDDPFAYRYDTQMLIDRRDRDLDEDEIAEYITTHIEGNSLIAVGDEDMIKAGLRQFFSTGVQNDFRHSCALR